VADDITLTVRVRDLTHGDFNRMGQRLNRMRQNLNGLGTSSRNASVHTHRLSRDIDNLGNSFLRMRNEGRLTTTELNNMRTALTGMQRDARNSARAGDITRDQFRSLTREMRHMRTEFDRFDGNFLMRFGRIGRMANTALGPVRMLGSGFQSLGQSAMRGNDMALILLGTLLLLGPAAQALGALLTVALGGAFVALGALALKNSATVKGAFSSMKDTVASSVREAAQPLEGALAAGLRGVGKAVAGMKGDLKEAFGATAPLVEDLFGAFTDFARTALPGFTEALRSMGPVMDGFRTAMGLIGKGMGDMFAAMMSDGGAEALKNVWIVLGNEIRNLLVGIGEFINFAAKSESATLLMVGAFRLLSGVLNLVEAGLSSMDSLLRNLVGVIDGIFGPLLSLFDMDIPGLDDMLNLDAEGAKAALGDMKAAQDGAAKAAQEHARSIKGLIEQVQSLADLNRSHLDAQSAQFEALNKAKEGAGQYTEALKMQHGVLDLTNTSAQEAYKLLSDLASATKATTDKAIEAKQPWEQVRSNWQASYNDLVALADGMGLSKEQAQQLTTQILGMPPSREVWIQARVEQARSDIGSVIAAFEATPNAKSVTVSALTADAVRHLQSFGFKITHLPDGKTMVETATGSATTNIETLRSLLNGINGKTVNTYVNTHVNRIESIIKQSVPGPHASGYNFGRSGGLAGSLPRKRFAGGGSVAGDVLEGPGTKTSDSLVARLSRGEFVMRAAAVDKYGAQFMAAVNSGRFEMPRFAKGGKVSAAAKAEREARNGAVGDLTISHFGKMAGFKTTEFAGDTARPDSLSDLVGALNNWRSIIKKATHGGVERNLLRRLDSAGKALIKWEKKLSTVEKSLDKAKDKLNDLKSAASQLRESVKSGVLSATNITNVADGDKPVTVSGIMSRMRQGRDKSAAFSQALKDLKARGVNKTIIEQIATAGIEGGGLETAGALLSASGSELASINSMQSQINSFAAGAGNTAADAMYGAGIKAAEGLVRGLERQKKNIEKAMMSIAKSMEKAIKKALGIKSPSKVMEKVGHFTAEGFAVGVERNRRAALSWDSMLNVRPVAAGSAQAGAGGGTQVIQLVVAGRVLDELVLDSNRRTVRKQGGDVQAVYGKKIAKKNG
jgi:predicted  nucleic acid-binding Zn-ribbon protein